MREASLADGTSRRRGACREDRHIVERRRNRTQGLSPSTRLRVSLSNNSLTSGLRFSGAGSRNSWRLRGGGLRLTRPALTAATPLALLVRRRSIPRLTGRRPRDSPSAADQTTPTMRKTAPITRMQATAELQTGTVGGLPGLDKCCRGPQACPVDFPRRTGSVRQVDQPALHSPGSWWTVLKKPVRVPPNVKDVATVEADVPSARPRPKRHESLSG